MASPTFVQHSIAYRGDYPPDAVIRIPWATTDALGQPVARSDGTLKVVSAYPWTYPLFDEDGVTPIYDEDGVTPLLGEEWESVAGLTDERNVAGYDGYHVATIDPTASEFFRSAMEYSLAWITSTGAQMVAEFSIKRATAMLAELSALPAWGTATAEDLLRLLATIATHKRDQSDTAERLYMANGSTVLATRTTGTSGGKFTQGKLS